MSDERKRQLLEWAGQVGSFVLEDDYACEFRQSRTASAPLAAMPNAQRVVYMNTFSTTIFPSLRLSYLIVPRAISDRFAEAIRRTERYATVPNQIVLADFIAAGHFGKHLRRCRDAYAERRKILTGALADACGDWFLADPASGGMHLCVRFRRRVDDEALAVQAREAGVIVEPLSRFYANPTGDSGMLLGFAGFRPDTLRDAAKHLSDVVALAVAPNRAAAG
jgi:GntR family transcriptional regulator/MocR family aminotransferase